MRLREDVDIMEFLDTVKKCREKYYLKQKTETV